MVAPLVETGYRVQKLTQAALAGLVMRVFHQLLRRHPLPPAAQRNALQRRLMALFAQDLANVRAGLYPERLLFRSTLRETLRVLPEGLREVPRIILRARRRRFQDLPALPDPDRYPRYYRRTFHWQSDGWFSERSARLYDPGVEMLFGGTAEIMRRMLLPDLVAFGRGRALRVLDVACGTGRTLDQVHAALPDARLTGLDLSEPYLSHTRRALSHVPDLELVAANAEHMPFDEGAFDAVTTAFLFHELPSDARRNVLAECYRVLAPGGMLLVVDSAQRDDAADVIGFLEAFPVLYHEPYYKGYVADPLPAMISDAGFRVASDRDHFLARVVVATKPGSPR